MNYLHLPENNSAPKSPTFIWRGRMTSGITLARSWMSPNVVPTAGITLQRHRH